ncbi:MAG TPA: sialidase family protein [Thermoanaerobaculia bacterium]|nr:sialidase family protein [Thermoanaerobaculia bacterium]
MSRVCQAVVLFMLLSSALSFADTADAEALRRPEWPSLQAQLAADRVTPGSALEQLVAENQELGLLRPEEAEDKLPIPVWLRVLWRKSHPDMVYNPADPTGGYPFLLKEIHEWMRSHPDLEPGKREPDVLPIQTLSTVGIGVPHPNLRISGRAPNPRSESDIQVFEPDPQRIVAASNNIEGSGRQAQYWSADGGETWGETTLELIEDDLLHSDPTVGWTSDGTAWSSTIGIHRSFGDLRLRLFKSTDGGATWTFDSTFSGDQTDADKQMVEIDTWPGSPFRDSIHAIWHNGEPVYMNSRRNGTWGSPRKVSGPETTGTGIGADVETNAAGHVFGLWPDTGSRRIYLVKSTNGGASWSKPSVVARTHGSFDIGIPAQNERRALIYVAAGAWKPAHPAGEDLVYAAWTDLSGSRNCRSPAAEPEFFISSTCKTRIWFTRSTDGGATWKPKRMIHHPDSRLDQFNPALVVDAATGYLALVYYQTGEGFPGRKRTHLWYQASYDRGLTWTKPLRVTTARSNETIDGADDSNQYGDYNGITGYAGTFFPSWTDRRKGRTEEIWTAPVVDAGPKD